MALDVIDTDRGAAVSHPPIWIWGGTGRTGRAAAAALRDRGHAVVLLGRDAERLTGTAGPLGADTLVAADPAALAALIRAHRPAVVLTTVGPFATAAPVVLAACLEAGSHYADLANDAAAVLAVLDHGERARAAGCVLVTGAGFGAAATETVVAALCAERPTPVRVRTDMVPSVELTDGRLGEALAGTVVAGLPGLSGGGRFQGRRYRGGRLVPARLAGDRLDLTLPDGSRARTALMPLGELVAAQRVSGAADVSSASSEIPSGLVAAAVLPAAVSLLAWRPLRELIGRRLADVRLRAAPRPRPHSWGHARVEWAGGEAREGWLRLGDAQAFTVAVLAEVAHRLATGPGRPGAHTPAALFGPALAQACGATLLLDAPTHGHAALWLRRGGAFAVGPAPAAAPGPGEVVVRTRAVAVNPVDALPAPARHVVLPWLRYPTVIGSDVAGEVIRVGPGVNRFTVGDRVVGHAVGGERSRNSAAEGAFAEEVVLLADLTAAVPDTLALEQAAVLPLALSTAACGLFQADQLGLRIPGPPALEDGRVVVVWGGSTSVGSNAIQLARAAGYRVVATASPRNFDFVRGLGAEASVDHRDPDAVADLVTAVAGREVAGILAIGAGALVPCIDLARRTTGPRRVASSQPTPLTRWRARRARRRGVTVTAIWGATLMDNEVGAAVYADFLPAALAAGSYRAAPPALVVGHGLADIPAALARLKRGVSAQKLVVRL